MTVVSTLRKMATRRRLEAYAGIYDSQPQRIPELQLQSFNGAWRESLTRSPWARALQQRLKLPTEFASWSEFVAAVPVQRKEDFRKDLEAAPRDAVRAVWRATGGTTAEPFRFPAFASESRAAALDMGLGRARLGIQTDDRLFLIWGHSHLFGKGLKGLIARGKRQISDFVLGYTRWNGYKLIPEELNRAADALIQSRARYVIGYSSALDRFARANALRATELRRLGLIAVIATAESMPRADSRQAIADCFGCPVFMEYGSVETGPIAYERRAGEYAVFWAHHRVELGEASQGARDLVVTSLFPRALPLLRYATGDLVRLGVHQDPAIAFEAAIGRCNDIVALADGSQIHSEAFTHALRDIDAVRAFQIVRKPSGQTPIIRLELAKPIGAEALSVVRERLGKVNPTLSDVAIETVAKIQPSVAGKHRMVVEEA